MGDANGESVIALGRVTADDLEYCEHGALRTIRGKPTKDGCPECAETMYDHVGASWRAVDLEPYLAGARTRPEPTVGLSRADGLRMLYGGKEHTVIGEMESGKSWFALGCVAAELNKGNRVLYVHAEEADPLDTVERLRALGVTDDAIILDLFTFVGPNEPVDPYALEVLLNPPPETGRMSGVYPSLVVLDGVNELMSMNGHGIRDEDGVAAFRRHIVKPCTAVGAAVLSCDHVVKDRERRGRDPLGSIHKGNGITGSLILLENASPFGRGERGCSHVFVTKDRPGFLRRNGRPGKLPGKTYMGSLIVDDTRTMVSYLDLTFVEPPDEDKADGPKRTRDEQDDDAVLQVVATIADNGRQPSLRTVRAKAAGMSNSRIDNALTRLALDRRLIERQGPRSSRLFTVPEAKTDD